MVSLSPSEASTIENNEELVTKNRYLKFRDDYSTTSRFGFRIEGIQKSNLLTNDLKPKLQPIDSIQTTTKYLIYFIDVSTIIFN